MPPEQQNTTLVGAESPSGTPSPASGVTTKQPKVKSMRLYWATGGLLLIVFVAAGVYYGLNRFMPKASTTSTTQSSATATPAESALQSVTNAYSASSADESQLIQSNDDSQLGSDATKSAANIGDSIDESSL